MGMEYDSPPVAGGFFSNKRNVLIAAGILGGGAGLVFLLSRRGASSPDPSQTTKGATAQDIAWGNLANQLLGFRGDVSVAMAKQSDQQHDLLDQFLTESQARQASDSQLFHLTSWLDFAREYETRQNMYAQAINASDDPTTRASLSSELERFTIWTNAAKERAGFNPSGTFHDLYGKALPTDSWLADNRDAYVRGISPWYMELPATTPPAGAGGASIRDVLYTIVDNSQGNAYDGYAVMSAGPVRYQHRAQV